MVPHKIIDKDQFMELSKAEGEVVPVFKLTNIPFDPPLPDGDSIRTRQMDINVLLMNVTEPVIYKDVEQGVGFIIMNGYDQENTFTYENFRDCHIIKDPVNAWGYRFAPSWWDEEEDDMDDPVWVFRHEEYPSQGLDDVKEAA